MNNQPYTYMTNLTRTLADLYISNNYIIRSSWYTHELLPHVAQHNDMILNSLINNFNNNNSDLFNHHNENYSINRPTNQNYTINRPTNSGRNTSNTSNTLRTTSLRRTNNNYRRTNNNTNNTNSNADNNTTLITTAARPYVPWQHIYNDPLVSNTPANSRIRAPLNTLFRNISLSSTTSDDPFIDNFDTFLNGLLSGQPNIRPNQAQIENATITTLFCNVTSPITTICPIRFENFTDNDEIMLIRHCRHLFSKSSLLNWFRTDSRCPICRYDIRTYYSENNNMNTISDNLNLDNAITDNAISDNDNIDFNDDSSNANSNERESNTEVIIGTNPISPISPSSTSSSFSTVEMANGFSQTPPTPNQSHTTHTSTPSTPNTTSNDSHLNEENTRGVLTTMYFTVDNSNNILDMNYSIRDVSNNSS